MIIVCSGSVQASKRCNCTMVSGLCELSVKWYAYVKKDFDIGHKSNGQQPTTNREIQCLSNITTSTVTRPTLTWLRSWSTKKVRYLQRLRKVFACMGKSIQKVRSERLSGSQIIGSTHSQKAETPFGASTGDRLPVLMRQTP